MKKEEKNKGKNNRLSVWKIIIPVALVILILVISFFSIRLLTTSIKKTVDTPSLLNLSNFSNESREYKLLEDYFARYLEHFGINQEVKRIDIIEGGNGGYTLGGGWGEPSKEIYRAVVVLENEQAMDFHFTPDLFKYEDEIPLRFTDESWNGGDTTYFGPSYGDCFMSNNECGFSDEHGYSLMCENKFKVYAEYKRKELNNYFSCKCTENKEWRIYLASEYDIRDCDEYWPIAESINNNTRGNLLGVDETCGCHYEGSNWTCRPYYNYDLNRCEVDFKGFDFESMPYGEENKTRIIINNTVGLPYVDIQMGNSKSKIKKDLTKGENVIDTEGYYSHYGCIRLFYEDVMLLEKDCFYRL